MKKHWKEIVIWFIQMFMFYVFPLFAGPTDAMGMVLLILLSVFLLSAVIGAVSKSRIKYLYPAVIAVLFIPSVWIYYNESALVHALWYLVTASVGMLPGLLIRKFIA